MNEKKSITPLQKNNLYFSELLKKKVEKKDDIWKKSRSLRKEEIQILEKQGNRAEDWSLVKVKENFLPNQIRNSWFIGSCFLGVYSDKAVGGFDSLIFKSGIYNSIIANSTIEDESCILNVNYLNNFLIEENCILYNIGTLSAQQINFFGN
ncbi:MAG: DUF4954 family protein, partial [Chitinispirillaceae bacterium]|nr:DUF4954 family protein [Chitinispirillaceae bacterium]